MYLPDCMIAALWQKGCTALLISENLSAVRRKFLHFIYFFALEKSYIKVQNKHEVNKMDSFVCFDKVCRTYDMGQIKIEALKNASFNIQKGEI